MSRTVRKAALLAALLALPAAAAAQAPATPKPPEALYRDECGACHMAYPTGFLPAASWRKILGGLDDHFGQNAELAPADRAKLETWLAGVAAESGTNRKSGRILRSIRGGEPPIRISEVPYVRRKHRELKASVFARPSIGSRANCSACHPNAEAGSFHERRVPKN